MFDCTSGPPDCLNSVTWPALPPTLGGPVTLPGSARRAKRGPNQGRRDGGRARRTAPRHAASRRCDDAHASISREKWPQGTAGPRVFGAAVTFLPALPSRRRAQVRSAAWRGAARHCHCGSLGHGHGPAARGSSDRCATFLTRCPSVVSRLLPGCIQAASRPPPRRVTTMTACQVAG